MSIATSPPFPNLTVEPAKDNPNVIILTMNKPPENRLNVRFAQTIISALRYIETTMLKPDAPGAVVITSFVSPFSQSPDSTNPTPSPVPEILVHRTRTNRIRHQHLRQRRRLLPPPSHATRLPIPDHRLHNRPHLRRRLSLRTLLRLPRHELHTGLHFHASRQSRPALRRHR